MYKLKEHEDFISEIITNCKNNLGAAICLLLKEGFDAESRSDFYRSMIERKIIIKSYRTFLKLMSDLIENGIIIEENPHKVTNTYRNIIKEEPPRISGVYGIFLDDSVYVGLSKDIYKRWVQHRKHISNKTHNYFHCESNKLEFKILHHCEEDRLQKCELLMAQKLKTEGFNILNEENFYLI